MDIINLNKNLNFKNPKAITVAISEGTTQKPRVTDKPPSVEKPHAILADNKTAVVTNNATVTTAPKSSFFKKEAKFGIAKENKIRTGIVGEAANKTSVTFAKVAKSDGPNKNPSMYKIIRRLPEKIAKLFVKLRLLGSDLSSDTGVESSFGII
jgi:hypothetical protein